MSKRKRKDYVLDSEVGIRRLDELKRLNVLELTDDEHVKVFMDRFEAKCVVLLYLDKDGRDQVFSRLLGGQMENLKRLLSAMRYYMLSCGVRGNVKLTDAHFLSMSDPNTMALQVDTPAITQRLLMAIAHDAGATTVADPDYQRGHFKPQHVKTVEAAVSTFYLQFPHFLNEEDLDLMAIGEYQDRLDRFEGLAGFDELDQALNAFHDDL